MKKSELMELVGRVVTVQFLDGTMITGLLKYADDFSEKHDYKKPDYFYIDNCNFKVSHIRSALPTTGCYLVSSGCGTGKTHAMLSAIKGDI